MRAQAIRAVLLAIAIAACLADMRPSSFVDLEHLLCKVEPDGGNSRHGRPSLVIRFNDHSTALRCLLRRRPPHQGPTNHSPCGRSLRATAPPPATDSIGGLLLFVDVWGCVPIADDRSPEHTLRCEGWPEAW